MKNNDPVIELSSNGRKVQLVTIERPNGIQYRVDKGQMVSGSWVFSPTGRYFAPFGAATKEVYRYLREGD